MTLSNTGMRDAIIAQIADPMVDGYTKEQALAAAGGNECILAMARAVVAEIKDATADTDFATSGTCGNFTAQPGNVQTPGSYAGTIEATDRGSISGMSASDLTQAIRTNITNAVNGVDFSLDNAENARHCTAAISEAIVEEVHTNGRVSLDSFAVSGTAPGPGGTPTGDITVTCEVSNLSATDLRDRIIAKITSKVGSGEVDFDQASARANILSISTGIVSHVHANAEVSVTTDFDGVNCPVNPSPTPGLSSTGNVSVDDAPIT